MGIMRSSVIAVGQKHKLSGSVLQIMAFLFSIDWFVWLSDMPVETAE